MSAPARPPEGGAPSLGGEAGHERSLRTGRACEATPASGRGLHVALRDRRVSS
jgi:hypothetical protein